MTASGESIGPYLLGRRLGQGGFAAVYEATHRETGQRVAIKFLLGSQELEPEAQNRFVREVALLKRLDHKNIIRFYDAGLYEGSIFCALEMVDCGTIRDVLATRGELPWREAAEVSLQVCYALDHAHQHGCVHRDLKPANLYLSGDGVVKLGDLGLARDLTASRLTTSGQTVGTWHYMPPELITAMEEIDGRLDLYALGCILFEMIAGQVPFDGPDFATIFDQHLDVAPPRLDVATDDCPKELADLVDQLLEKKPVDRPGSAAEVASRLETMLAGELAPKKYASGVLETLVLESDLPSRRPNLAQRLHHSHEATTRGSKWPVMFVGGVFLLLALILVVVLIGEK